MHRVVVILTILLSACGGGAVGLSPPSTVPDEVRPSDGVLVELRFPPGECMECDYRLELRADGLMVYQTPSQLVQDDYDVDELVRILDAIDLDDLVTGNTDCGREVDGNAEILTVGGTTEIDFCYRQVDESHPLIQFVRSRLGSAEELAARSS